MAEQEMRDQTLEEHALEYSKDEALKAEVAEIGRRLEAGLPPVPRGKEYTQEEFRRLAEESRRRAAASE